MRTYKEIAMIVNGRKTCNLEIFRDGNMFSIFEHEMNVYHGGWLGMTEFIEKWKAKWQPLMDAMTAQGMQTEWIMN